MTASVAVVVPMRNAEQSLPALLDALADQRDLPSYDVVMVDNGSRDNTVLLAQTHPLQPEVLVEPARGSFRARNAGWRAAEADVIAFTDADCVPTPGWLHAGIAALASCDIVGGRVATFLGPEPNVWERLDAGHYLDQRRNVQQQHFAATANMFIRREQLQRLGGFAELRSGGDRELCKRARERGLTLGYDNDALVWHRPRSSMRQTWQLNRRIGYSLRDLHRLDMHPAWHHDQQMLLSPRWARGTSSDESTRTGVAAAMTVWLTVIGARWVGRTLGR
jgi:cellulose synthase/poly-beta-1,6-N-acetylglucosamine synthase-like glycosyltransferase